MSNVIAPWLVSAKVSPPRHLVNACRRTQLLAKLLNDGINHVTILEAPAGFGKTLFLSQWREELKSESHIVAWVSIEESDEADIIIPYIAYAFQKAGLCMHDTGLLSPSFHGLRTAYSLGRILTQVENSHTQCVLMLDDVERSNENILSEIIAPLIYLLPENLHLVIACRQNPGIPLSNLSVQGRLTLLGSKELRFNKDEIGELFGQKLDYKDIDTIFERTDGWPVAIQLLKSFAGDSSALPSILSTFSGNSKDAADYFREQLLETISDDELLFLKETAILNPVHLDCANFIRKSTNSQSLVQQLHYLEGIFMPLEGDDETYRLHPLVREYLQETLKESSLDSYNELCRSTARWMAEKQQYIDAMRYALQADAVDLACEIFEQMQGGPQLWLSEGMSRLRTGLDLLSKYDIDRFPRIHLARSLVYAKDGQIKKAYVSFNHASELSKGFTSDREGGDNILFLIDRYIVELILTEYGCSPPTNALKSDALKYILDNVEKNTAIHGYVMTLHCLANMQAGFFQKSIQYGRTAIADFKECGSKYAELFIYIHFGMSELALCKSQNALVEYQKANRIVQTEFPGDKALKRICNVVLGELYWQLGNVSQARKYLMHVMTDAKYQEAWFDIYMARYQTIAEYLLHESGKQYALLFIEKAKAHAQEQDLARLEIFIDSLRSSILYFSHQIDTSVDYKANIQDVLGDPRIQITWREIEMVSLAHSRVALLNKEYEIAFEKIKHLISYAEKTGNNRLMTNGFIQKSIIEIEIGSDSEAIDSFIKAVNLAKDGHYVRPFLLNMKSINKILDKIPNKNCFDEKGLDIVNLIIDPRWFSDSGEYTSSILSAREIEVLSELSKGHSDKMIAQSLFLTPHGVRYHLKKIYSKMGVKSRSQAIAKANELDLIH